MKTYQVVLGMIGMIAGTAPAAAATTHTFANGCTRTCSGTWINGQNAGSVQCANADGSAGTVGPLNCPASGPGRAIRPELYDPSGNPVSAPAPTATPRRIN